MGAANKLLADVGGKPMVRHAVDAALASPAAPVLVVTGHMASEVSATLQGTNIIPVHNPDYATGLASSLKAGIRSLPTGCAGALIMLGDMPRIAPEHINALLDAFTPDAIVVPVHQGRPGNPVLWPAKYFPELLQLDGDAGARRLLSTYTANVCEIDLGSDAIFTDVDTPEALAALQGGG